MVEIPEMFKHYIQECKHRNLFKECEDCNECILKEKDKEHKGVCKKMFSTKCPLCMEIFDGKLKLKEHILKKECPNNNR